MQVAKPRSVPDPELVLYAGGLPKAGVRAARLSAHLLAAHAACVDVESGGEANVVAFHLPLGRDVAAAGKDERAAERLEILGEAHFTGGQAPGARDLRRDKVKVRGAPGDAVAVGVRDVGLLPAVDAIAVVHDPRARRELEEFRRE